jgi:hypothetical protein
MMRWTAKLRLAIGYAILWLIEPAQSELCRPYRDKIEAINTLFGKSHSNRVHDVI